MLFVGLVPYIAFCVWISLRGIQSCKGYTGRKFCFCIVDLWTATLGMTPSIGIGSCIVSAMLGYESPSILTYSWRNGQAEFWLAVWLGITAGSLAGTIVGKLTSIEWEPFETRPALVSAARTLTGSLLGFLSFVLYSMAALFVAVLAEEFLR